MERGPPPPVSRCRWPGPELPVRVEVLGVPGRQRRPFRVGAGGHRRQGGIPADPRDRQVAERGPARVPDGRVAAGQRDRQQVADPLEAGGIGADEEDLAAPDRPVGAVPGAVEGDADHLIAQAAVLGQQRRNVRVVMLDEVQGGLARSARVPLRPVAGSVGRVQVGRDHLRGDPVRGRELRDDAVERAQRRQVAHVADVSGAEGAVAVGEAAGVLHLAADRQHRRQRPSERHRERGVTPSAPDRQLTVGQHPDHGVVARHVNRAVVGEHRVGEEGQLVGRLPVVEDDRLVADVCAGQNQCVRYRLGPAGNRGEQQVVNRRVGQQHAEQRAARRDRVRDRCARQPAQQHDRARRPGQRPLLARVDLGQQPSRGQIPCQHREGLVAPRLALSEPGDRLRAVGPAGQVVTADALHRDDPALGENPLGGCDRLVGPGRGDAVAGEPESRATVVTGDRLGVEPAVGRIVVLPLAPSAHREAGHRGRRAVIGRSLMIVNRGPQSVQVMNGWRYRRLAGSNSSRRQASQVATSGGTSVRCPPALVDATMRKPSSASAAPPASR